MTWSLEYIRRLYEVFHAWNKDENPKAEENETKHYYTKWPRYLGYVRDVFVKMGAYLDESVRAMTDGIKRIWMKYFNDEFALDHELGHILGMDEYQVRSAMAAGWRAPRWKFRLHFD